MPTEGLKPIPTMAGRWNHLAVAGASSEGVVTRSITLSNGTYQTALLLVWKSPPTPYGGITGPPSIYCFLPGWRHR